MQVTAENTSPTTIRLTLVADQALLDEVKRSVLAHLSKSHVKLQGFRQGKAPLSLVEKSVDPNVLQSEFLEEAINRMYTEAVNEQKLRVVSQPQVSVKKFVPFTTLEIEAEAEAVGSIVLPDYKKIKAARKPVQVTEKDIDAVITDLKARVASRKAVKRPAKHGDEVVIDFAGTDTATGEAISGADGKDYPLILGSNSFIPGFEDKLVGAKPGDERSFALTFPADYGVKALQKRKVTFAVKVNKVQEISEPAINDAFAAKVGPFKTLAELRTDIRRQLESEKEYQADRDFESELIEKIAEKAEAAIPKVLVDEEIDRQEQQERQNLAYRGQTWQEHLAEEGLTDEQHHERIRPAAEQRVKAGLVLAEIADKEGVTVTPEELELRVQLYKGQYQDAAMQAELDKPENRRDIVSRLMSEKTIAKLAEYATTQTSKK